MRVGTVQERILDVIADNGGSISTQTLLTSMFEKYQIRENAVYRSVKRLRQENYVRRNAEKVYEILRNVDGSKYHQVEHVGLTPAEAELFEYLELKKINSMTQKMGFDDDNPVPDIIIRLSMMVKEERLKVLVGMFIHNETPPTEIADTLNLWGFSYDDTRELIKTVLEYRVHMKKRG